MTDNDRINRIREGFARIRNGDTPLVESMRRARELRDNPDNDAFIELAVGEITYRDPAEQALADAEREHELRARAGIRSNVKATPPAVDNETHHATENDAYTATADRIVADVLKNL